MKPLLRGRFEPLRAAGRTDLGAWPVVGGLIVIAVVFGSLNEHFLSPENLTNLALQMAATGTISLGIIMVILLGEIDLSAGSVSGLCAVVMTILYVHHGWNPLLAVAAALAMRRADRPAARLDVHQTGDALIRRHARRPHRLARPDAVSAGPRRDDQPAVRGVCRAAERHLAAAVGGLAARRADRRRRAAPARWSTGGCAVRPTCRSPPVPGSCSGSPVSPASSPPRCSCCSADRGVPLLLVIFGTLVVCLDLMLQHTVFGRHMYAVGGNAEAARRAGINITRIRLIAFVAASTLAAFGGILAASRLAAVNQSSGGSDTLLMAIAAAVIGGTSLFGGRGRACAALLGILVIQSITNGMLLLSVDSSVRYMVTAAVLAIAVAIDSLARRGQPR